MLEDDRFGLATTDQLAHLSGIELLRGMIEERVLGPTIARALEFRLIEVGEGMAVFEGVASPRLLNPLGTVHGGVALTLIDSAAGCALHTLLDAGVGYASVETKVNFTRPIRGDGSVLRAEGRVVTRGRQIATAEARVLNAAGKVVAHGTSTLMIAAGR